MGSHLPPGRVILKAHLRIQLISVPLIALKGQADFPELVIYDPDSILLEEKKRGSI
jgi:hypothetical protein